jgi:hypothetical protein
MKYATADLDIFRGRIKGKQPNKVYKMQKPCY